MKLYQVQGQLKHEVDSDQVQGNFEDLESDQVQVHFEEVESDQVQGHFEGIDWYRCMWWLFYQVQEKQE